MKVKALVSFAGSKGTHAKDQIFDLPDGVDWLEVGFVVPVEDEPETASVPKPKRKSTK